MNGTELLLGLGRIDAALVAEAAETPPRRATRRWAALAACLVLALGLGAAALRHQNSARADPNPHRPVNHWTEDMRADRYFQYGDGTGVSSSSGSSVAPWAESRDFSGERAAWEAEGILPVMAEHLLFDAAGYYNADGSLYSVQLGWYRRPQAGERLEDAYSDLVLTAGRAAVPQISDVVSVELDADGRVVSPAITVTERDGVYIVGERGSTGGGTLTWQTDAGWYQLSGSWNDSYDDLVLLLDWFWAHPLDFDRFSVGRGDRITQGTLADCPEAAPYLPDFAALGYGVRESESVTLRNGRFERLEVCHTDAGGTHCLWWVVDAAPDYYERKEALGAADALTYEQVAAALREGQHVTFL